MLRSSRGLGLDSIDALELVLGSSRVRIKSRREVGVKAFASVNALVDFIEHKKIA